MYTLPSTKRFTVLISDCADGRPASADRGYKDILMRMLGNLQLSEDYRPSWGGRVRRMKITTHLPAIERTPEEKIREKRMNKRKRDIEEAFYREAWRMEVKNGDKQCGTQTGP